MSNFKIKLPGGHPAFGGHETGNIPHAKKPKVRPPRGWRDNFMVPARSLPTYTGPYPVATMEIEVPASNPQVFSDITRHRRHVLQLETVLMTIYYPTSHEDFNLQKHDSRFSRQLWLGRPRFGMAAGIADFGGFGPWAIPVFFPAWFTKLPAYRNAPLASHWAPMADTKAHGTAVKMESVPRPEGAPHEPCFPLLLFSHGLGGTRTMYSSQCGEYASHGFVVCAIEHRDGSGPRTYVNHCKSGWGSAEHNKIHGGIDHDPKASRRGYDVIDYLWPQGNPKDTMPNNEKGVDHELRGAQIALRIAEVEEAYKIVCEIANGKGQLVADRNLRRQGFKASSSHGLDGVNWSKWKGRVRLDHVTACGHSFGAATVTEILRHPDRFPYISQGIIYDIWGAGTRAAEQDAPQHRIHVPLLAINSEAFTYWPTNFKIVESLIDEARADPHSCPSWLMTLRGTVHVSQSDFSILWPHVTSFLLKAVVNPKRALDLNVNATLEFLSIVLPKDMAQVIRTYNNEGILESHVEPLESIKSKEKHEPNQKHIAERLKIEHEILYRITPGLVRKLQRRRNRKSGREPESCDEVWLHMKPTPQCIDRHLGRMSDTLLVPRTEFHPAVALPDDAENGVPVP